MKEYTLKITSFDLGVIMAKLEPTRNDPPVKGLWDRLMAIMMEIRDEAGVQVEDLGSNMVRMTDKAGNVIIRERYSWEKP